MTLGRRKTPSGAPSRPNLRDYIPWALDPGAEHLSRHSSEHRSGSDTRRHLLMVLFGVSGFLPNTTRRWSSI